MLAKARRQVADAIGADPREILFTSGGSEGDNQAIRGIASARKEKGGHIITTAIEHHAVLNTCRWLEQRGYEVSCIRPDAEGRIDPLDVRNAIREDTILISVMAANNEIGTIEPVADIGQIARERGIPFHIDAVQAVGAIPVDVNAMNADLLSLSAHKFYGPKGVGALYVRHGIQIDPLILGGRQEFGLRAGTENIAGIVGLGKAIEEASDRLAENSARTAGLRDYLAEGILSSVPGSKLNGPRDNRLPNNCNICFGETDGEAFLLLLDMAGIAASSGSACSAGSRDTSHVLKAIGLTEKQARSSLRFSVGIHNTKEEMDKTIMAVRDIARRLKSMNGN